MSPPGIVDGSLSIADLAGLVDLFVGQVDIRRCRSILPRVVDQDLSPVMAHELRKHIAILEREIAEMERLIPPNFFVRVI